MKRSRKIMWIPLLAMLCACNKETESAPSAESEETHANEIHLSSEALEGAAIHIATVGRRALTGGVAVPAEVQFEASSTAHISPLVSGRMVRVTVRLGDHVTRGQLLGVVASSDVSAARASLDQANARLTAAESTLRRQQVLQTEGIGAQRQLIDAEAQVSQLRAEAGGLRRQLSVFGSGSSGQLSLVSPIDGVIVEVHGTLGETVTPDRPTFTVTDPTQVWVRGNVPELEIDRLQQGTAALVRLHAFPDAEFLGTITYVAPALDEQSRSLPIRVTLAAQDTRLRSGLFGSIELIGADAEERTLVVPVGSVTNLNGQDVVFTAGAEAGAFRPTSIVVGRRAGGFFEVRSGIAEGTRIATTGAFTLKSALLSAELEEDE